MPSGGPRSTTSTWRSAPGWTGSAAGGGRGTTATSSAEYWAVREGVSIGDVSTLGKLVVSGPDVVEALERIYPCHVADIKPGRSRYALLLNERGHVMDDGMILRDAETRFTLTFTSGGAANAEMWLRDWIDTWGLRVHVMDRTMSLAAINVTGPLAGELLRRLGLAEPPRFLGHVRADDRRRAVPRDAAVVHGRGRVRAAPPGRPVASSCGGRCMDAGRDLGIRPHGLQALFGLRLEKGHVIVGMDTELDTTPRRLGMDWAARMEKPFFIGRAALERTATLEDERRWVGFAMDGEAPPEGSPIRSVDDGDVIGNVTGSWTSPLLGRALMLGWQRLGRFDDEVEIDGRRGGRDADAVLRPGGPSVPALEPVDGRPRRRRARGPRRGPLGRRRRRRPPDRAGRGARARRDGASPSTATRTRSSSRRPASSVALLDRERAGRARGAHGVAAPRRRPAGTLAQGKIAGVPAKLARRRSVAARDPDARTPTSSSAGSDGAER